jgi:hypothetical protein
MLLMGSTAMASAPRTGLKKATLTHMLRSVAT